MEATGIPAITSLIADSVPFYGGITLDEIGGRGVRWQDREAASAAPPAELSDAPLEDPPEPPQGMRLGALPSLWKGPEVEYAPSLRFLAPAPHAELSAEDARRLGISPGDEVVLSWNGDSVRAPAAIRTGVPAGSVFVAGRVGEPRAVEVRKA